MRRLEVGDVDRALTVLAEAYGGLTPRCGDRGFVGASVDCEGDDLGPAVLRGECEVLPLVWGLLEDVLMVCEDGLLVKVEECSDALELFLDCLTDDVAVRLVFEDVEESVDVFDHECVLLCAEVEPLVEGGSGFDFFAHMFVYWLCEELLLEFLEIVG